MPAQDRDEPFDDELYSLLEATAAEYHRALSSHLVPALSRLKVRGTPLRKAERYDSRGVARLRFADGTTFLARAVGRGKLGAAAVAMLRGAAVLVSEIHDDGVEIHAVLTWGRGRHVECEILGDDQPD